VNGFCSLDSHFRPSKITAVSTKKTAKKFIIKEHKQIKLQSGTFERCSLGCDEKREEEIRACLVHGRSMVIFARSNDDPGGSK